MNFPFLVALIFIFVAGCATIQPPVAPSATGADAARFASYEFSGRIAVKQEEKGSYGNIRWIKHGAETEVTLVSPLGQIIAQIHSEPAGVTLTLADQRKFRAESGEKLTHQVLGYTVPVSGLNHWLLGRPAVGTPSEPRLRPDGLLDSLRQSGWAIQYNEYMTVNGLELPRRMVLNRDDLEIRLVVDQWTIGSDAKEPLKSKNEQTPAKGSATYSEAPE